MTASGTIIAVHVGRIARLGGDGRRSAYVKTPVAGRVGVHALGLDGDEQANRRYHGGPDKAVYGYPVSNYTGWRADMPELGDRLVPGAMGENLVIAGQDESSIHIGDIIRCGTALFQVAQLREPCAVFAEVMGSRRVVRAMTRSGRCGWYYRVLEAGDVGAGDGHVVVDRINPDWPVSRLAVFATGKGGTREALAALAALPGLNRDWQLRAAQALAAQRAPL